MFQWLKRKSCKKHRYFVLRSQGIWGLDFVCRLCGHVISVSRLTMDMMWSDAHNKQLQIVYKQHMEGAMISKEDFRIFMSVAHAANQRSYLG